MDERNSKILFIRDDNDSKLRLLLTHIEALEGVRDDITTNFNNIIVCMEQDPFEAIIAKYRDHVEYIQQSFDEQRLGSFLSFEETIENPKKLVQINNSLQDCLSQIKSMWGVSIAQDPSLLSAQSSVLDVTAGINHVHDEMKKINECFYSNMSTRQSPGHLKSEFGSEINQDRESQGKAEGLPVPTVHAGVTGVRSRKPSEKKLSDTYSESSSVKGVHKSTSSMEKDRGVSPNIYPIDHEIQQFYEEFNSPNQNKLLSIIDEQRSASENHSSRRKDLKFSSNKLDKTRNILLIQNNVFTVSEYEHSQTPRDSGHIRPDELGSGQTQDLPVSQQQLVQSLKKAKNPPKIGSATGTAKMKLETLETEQNKKIKESLRMNAAVKSNIARGSEEQIKLYTTSVHFCNPEAKNKMALNIPPTKSPTIYEQILNTSNPSTHRQQLAQKNTKEAKSMQHQKDKKQPACTFSSEIYHH